MPRCTFETPWDFKGDGTCGRVVKTPGERFCHEHRKAKCVSCGKPATKKCDYTGTPFVCGSYLCDDCTHDAPDHEEEHAPREVAEKHWEKHRERMIDVGRIMELVWHQESDTVKLSDGRMIGLSRYDGSDMTNIAANASYLLEPTLLEKLALRILKTSSGFIINVAGERKICGLSRSGQVLTAEPA